MFHISEPSVQKISYSTCFITKARFKSFQMDLKPDQFWLMFSV